jgi:hypothetical protein
VTTFRRYQDVAVVEHDDQTCQPRKGSRVMTASVTEAGDLFVKVRYENGSTDVYVQESGWHFWGDTFRWRLVSVCRCELPILGEPVTDPDDPTRREFCREACLTDAAEASHVQRYQPGVAT